MKFSLNLYSLMRSTRTIIDDRIYSFSPLDNGSQSRRKSLFICAFLRLWPKLSAKSLDSAIYNNSSRQH